MIPRWRMSSMTPRCPKCNALPAYIQEGAYACMMCGKRWPVNGVKPIVISKVEEDMSSEKRECRNCGRKKQIVGDGLCGGCYSAVYAKHKKGTPEYDQALAEAKARFTDPGRKVHRPRGPKASKPAEATTASVNDPPKPKKQDKDILSVLEDRRHVLMDEVCVINQTIATIKKYQAAA